MSGDALMFDSCFNVYFGTIFGVFRRGGTGKQFAYFYKMDGSLEHVFRKYCSFHHIGDGISRFYDSDRRTLFCKYETEFILPLAFLRHRATMNHMEA